MQNYRYRLDSKIYTRSSKKNFININKPSILIPFRTSKLLNKTNSGQASYLAYNLALRDTPVNVFLNNTFSQRTLEGFVQLLLVSCSYRKSWISLQFWMKKTMEICMEGV